MVSFSDWDDPFELLGGESDARDSEYDKKTTALSIER
jgi:hypothetical protein